VTEVLDRLKEGRGLPQRIKVDSRPGIHFESVGCLRIYHVKLAYSRPSTSTDNAHIESFNESFRDEYLNTNWFTSLEDTREKIERWKSN